MVSLMAVLNMAQPSGTTSSGMMDLEVEELLETAQNFTGVPKKQTNRDSIIGVVEDRTFEIIDHIYQK